MDLLANPQNRIFSPLLALDLILNPYSANLASLILYGIFGMLGMYRLLLSQGISQWSSLVGAVLFINSSWFGLHFTEGHIPYGSLQLLPWVLYFALTLQNLSSLFALLSLLALFILDGGIYTFIFSLLILVAGLSVGWVDPRKLIKGRSWKEISIIEIMILCFLLLISPKLIPVLYFHKDRIPHLDSFSIPPATLETLFFNPLQYNLLNLGPNHPWRFHEFGCYLGLLSVLLILIHLTRSRAFGLKIIKPLALFVFFFWTATGWRGEFNPWTFLQSISLIQNAHIQSRVFILMYLFFVMMVAAALDQFTHHKKLTFLIGVILISEATFVKTYPFFATYRSLGKPKPIVNLIHSHTLRETLEEAHKPQHYFSGKYGGRITYEPAAPRTHVRSIAMPSYQGEIYRTQGEGAFTPISITPGKITLYYSAKTPFNLEFNSNYLAGWRVTSGQAKIFPTGTSLIGAQFLPGSGKVTLEYWPLYLNKTLTFYALGVLLWLGLVFYFFLRKPGYSDFNYDKIPLGYYDTVIKQGNPIQQAWHLQKFNRVKDCLPKGQDLSILDVGCFSGTFLSLLPQHPYSRQIGVDILNQQINYANHHYKTSFRNFLTIAQMDRLRNLPALAHPFDCITCIEVIEHLPTATIQDFLSFASSHLKQGGQLILTTPNYISTWPILEKLINYFSEINYEDQHITKFNYFTVIWKLRKIYPEFDKHFTLEIKTTTHFLSPFLAWISPSLSHRISKIIPHRRWKLPFGNLILLVLTRNQESALTSVRLQATA